MKKLEEIFNLAETKKFYPTNGEEALLPSSDTTDAEFDELASKAVQAFDDLVDLGMSVEPKYTGRLFEVASSMLSNAITAKSAKVNKNLRLMDLELKRQKMEQSANPKDIEGAAEEVLISDRNSLLEKLKKMNQEDNINV